MKTILKLYIGIFVIFSVATLPAATSAGVGNWYKDPFGIAAFVNSKGYNVEALKYDFLTATKICQLAGYTDVQSYDCVSTYDWGRCGWFSCHDNTLSYWNGNTFVSMNACSAGNKWISSLVCKNTPISLSVSVSPNPATVNQTVTFNSSVSGGTGSYTYSWTGDCISASASCSKSFSQAGTYTATLTVTSGNQTKTASVTVTINQACTSHTSRQCFSNAVYWYDSCGNKEDLYQTCASNQTCQNGQCVNIACSSNSNCGVNEYVDSPYCQGNNVYQNYKTYICNNPGSANSSCSYYIEPRLKQTCSSNQVCQSGSCINQTIACSSNSDCGAGFYTGNPFCQGNSVYQNYTTYVCNNAGTPQSYCSTGSYIPQFKYGCASNQTCQNGQCIGQNITVETRSATNITYNSATLNGYLYYYDSYQTYCTNYVWFEYGPTTSYGNETVRQSQNYSGLFSQNINLASYTNYHFRAVAQLCNGNRVYGNDTVFYAGTQPTSGYLTINTTVKNQTSGGSFSNSVYANPSDTLLFLITIQATGNQDFQNVFLRDSLPSNLIYNDQLIVSCSGGYSGYNNCSSGGNYNYSGNITSGINLGTIYRGQTVTVSYQAKVAPAQNFAYGTTTLTNNVYATSSSFGYNPVNNASVLVARTAVYGATTIPTGLTNNFWVDSFFLPMLIVLIGLWMWRSGLFFWIEKWVDNRKKNRRAYKSEKELNNKIAAIKNSR